MDRRDETEAERERRLREAAVTKVTRQAPEPAPDEPEVDEDDDAARARFENQHLWVDHQIRQAMARGEFDNLPGEGKPLRLPDQHDPDWWVKGLIERERITAVLPPALALRKEDAELDGELDRMATEEEVRRALADFNQRVVAARRQLQGGPPVVTATREVEDEVNLWRQRRAERRAMVRAAELQEKADRDANRPWWRRLGPRR